MSSSIAKHGCAILTCPAVVSFEKLMCPNHWRMVPTDLQTIVYRTWRRRSMLASKAGPEYQTAKVEHVKACDAAIDAVTNRIKTS